MSIYKNPTVRPNLDRNGHDLSMRRKFTASPCMLLPVFHDLPNPGEHYKLNSSLFIRTEAMETAAMMKIQAHVDWFFVPITQIYSLWNEFFNMTQDNMSSIFLDSSNKTPTNLYTLPYFDFRPVILKPLDHSFFGVFDTGTPTDFILNVDETGTPYLWNFRRLWDMLDFGSLTRTQAGDSTSNVKICPLTYLAYHKIFHSHYNNTDWFPNDPTLYNLDKYFSTFNIPEYDALRITSTIHYRPYRRDYFTNVKPQPLFGPQYSSYLSDYLQSHEGSLRTLINPEYTLSAEGVTNAVSVDNNGQGSFGSLSKNETIFANSARVNTGSSISTADLRSVFALDKLLRINAFAGGHYEDQTLAHFGYKMPQGISKEAYFLGTQTTDISINEVVATATTTAEGPGSLIGDIAGKAFGLTNGQKDIDFTAPCHGVLMAIFSIEPIPEYASIPMNKQNTVIEPFDFYRPEFDNLGMQPLTTNIVLNNLKQYGRNVFGWQYRYSEFKTNYDVVNEGLWATDKTHWQGNKQMPFVDSRISGSGTNFNISVFNNFFIIPQYCNNIFALKYPYYQNKTLIDIPSSPDHAWYNTTFLSAQQMYQFDNFLISADFKCFKTSPMSVHSLPKLY